MILYNIFLGIFRVSAFVASFFSRKARLWLKGRENLLSKLEHMVRPGDEVIWMHCASLGEFEQGRPLLESLRKKYPRYRILLSFFSPSGYEVQKTYNGADWVIYMPLDGPRTARRFLETVKPHLVIFVKYEYWYYYLKKIKYRNIPLLLVSAHFRKSMSFFRWHGSLQRKMLSRFNQIFVQDAHSKELLDRIGFENITTISGDTRFDRVIEIAKAAESIDEIELFLEGKDCLVAGSTWPQDEKLLADAYLELGSEIKLILAPHEITGEHLEWIEKLFPSSSRFSSLDPHSSVLIIDNIGMLSRLYKYGSFCFVGGGMHPGGVHNVLEAAVYGKIVFYGMNHQKYREAVQLRASGGGIVVETADSLVAMIRDLMTNEEKRKKLEESSKRYVTSEAGATEKILKYVQENRLLTS